MMAPSPCFIVVAINQNIEMLYMNVLWFLVVKIV